MKVIIGIIAVGIITVLSTNIGPWWICGVVAFGVTFFMRLKPGMAFLAGFTGVLLSWGIISGWIDTKNSQILSTRIGELFMGISPVMVILVGALIGGLTGGMGGMTGGTLAALIFKSKESAHTTV
jgi:hypothetical protein